MYHRFLSSESPLHHYLIYYVIIYTSTESSSRKTSTQWNPHFYKTYLYTTVSVSSHKVISEMLVWVTKSGTTLWGYKLVLEHKFLLLQSVLSTAVFHAWTTQSTAILCEVAGPLLLYGLYSRQSTILGRKSCQNMRSFTPNLKIEFSYWKFLLGDWFYSFLYP